MVRKTSVWLAPVLAVVVWAAPASAQAPSQDVAAAQALFEEGRALMQKNQFDQACAKFAESQRLGPAAGTLLNLGECYLKLGKTATAWATFKEAVSAAQSAGQGDREQYAKERAAEVEPQLLKLTIKVDTPEQPGLVVKRDGVALGKAAWGTPVPVDPGAHVVEATATGKKAWTANVDASADKNLELVVPALEDAPPEATGGSGSTQKWIGLGVAGLGVVGVTVGAVFGLGAISSNDEAKTHCRTDTLCDAEGVELTDTAKGQATASTAFFIVGGAALVGGAILFFTAPGDGAKTKDGVPTSRVRFAPSFGPSVAGIGASGTW